MKHFKNLLVLSFALFAMFFGAGNFIFPPSLGAVSGTKWLLSFLGFLITGVGMPVLGVVSVALANGDLSVFTKALPEKLGFLFIISVLLIIGPLFAIPRTAASTFELAVLPFFDTLKIAVNMHILAIISKLIFFLLCLLFVFNRTNVLDNIGKILTPLLLLVLLLLIFRGLFRSDKLGEGFAQSSETHLFRYGFTVGYQTMDALASMLFATIVVTSILERGYKGSSEILKVSVSVGILACLGLSLVYMGLTYLGAASNITIPLEVERTKRLVGIARQLWDFPGLVILAISLALACLTTAVGLIATAASYFSDKLHVSYRIVAILVTLISFFISLIGVDAIVFIATPVLDIVYPIAIVLIVLSLFKNKISSVFIRGAVFGTLLITLPTVIISSFKVESLSKLLNFLPFSGLGLPWLLPALIMGALFFIVSKFFKSEYK